MASIGSLQADLRLESASFIRDLKKSADAVAANTSRMQRQMSGVQRSFAAAGSAIRGAIVGLISVGTIRSVYSLANAAIQAGDEIATAATRIGIAAEDLQRFRFAAAQADVETTQLDNALRMFAQNLAQGKISAEGASMAEAFRNYIEQIAQAPTQLEKVRIAQEAFGKQWQSAMLLAAQGADEFRKQADSAFVFSDKALEVASRLDNEFRALSNAVSVGFSTGLLEGFSQQVGRTHNSLQELNSAAMALGQGVAMAIQAITNLLNRTSSAFNSVKQQWDSLPDALKTAISSAISGMGFVLNPVGSVAGLLGGAGETGKQLDSHVQAWKSASDAINNYNAALGVGVDVQKQAAESARALKEAQAQQAQIFADTRTPFEAYQLELAKLNELVAKGTIGWDLYSRAVDKVTQDFQMNWMNSMQGAIGQMQGFTGALAQESKTWFQINKAFAIAQAIMSTYEGAAKALGQLGAWGIPVAAGIIATGLAYVAMIASQQPGSSGGSRGRGGGGRGGGGGDNGLSGAVRNQAVNVTLVGNSGFSSEQVLDLMERINGFMADGVKLNVSQG